MPTGEQIVQRLLDTIAVTRRGISGSRLKPGEARDSLDLLNGLAAALSAHQHIAYIISECAREITAKAAAAKSQESAVL